MLSEEKLNKIIEAKNKYELSKKITKQWQDFAYDTTKITHGDGYYNIEISEFTDIKRELTIHLPSVIEAMENYTDSLYKKYKELLKEE